MDNMDAVSAVVGWCTVINMVIYSLTATALTLLRPTIKNLHSKLTGVSVDRLDELYFNYLGNFKLAIIVFSLSPYLALKAVTL